MSAMDDHLIGYAHRLSQGLKPDEIVFIHIRKRHRMAPHLGEDSPDTLEKIRSGMQGRVAQFFGEDKTTDCKVYEGSAHFDLWRETYLQRIDLCILGEKTLAHSRKIAPIKFARKSFCSVLYVPEDPPPLDHIFVPTDFKSHGHEAIKPALSLAKAFGSDVILSHVYHAPHSESISKEHRQSYSQHFQDRADGTLKEAKEKFGGRDEKIRTLLVAQDESDLAEIILREAVNSGSGMIVINSGGKNWICEIFLGSTCHQLLALKKKLPLLIVKRRINQVKAWEILTNL